MSTAVPAARTGALASTGTAVGALLVAAFALLATGFGLVTFGRSRRQARHVG